MFCILLPVFLNSSFTSSVIKQTCVLTGILCYHFESTNPKVITANEALILMYLSINDDDGSNKFNWLRDKRRNCGYLSIKTRAL